MKPISTKLSVSLCIAAVAALVAGCASSGVKNPSGVPVTHLNADEQGFVAGTGVESQDLVTVTDKMARSIVGIPQIANAPTPPTIVLQPVENQTRFPINKDIFLTRIRAQLNSKSQGKVMFLARDHMEALEKERNLKREGAVTASSDPAVQEFKGADYFLTGTLQGLSTRTAAGTSDYILYDFHLIDARTSVIVWEDQPRSRSRGWKTRPIAELLHGDAGMKSFWQPTLLAGLLTLAGCATTTQQVALTGNVMVDGPNAIANGPPRDRVLWEYRTAAAAMRQGNFGLAKQYLDDALLTLGGIYGKDPNAKKARSYFHGEAKKTFIGEPYERSMAYIYRGILYWMDGEPDNARACFRSAEFEDSDAENTSTPATGCCRITWTAWPRRSSAATASDAFKRAQAAARGIKLPPYNPKANVLFFLEFGPGPTKFATGQYGEELRFRTGPSPVTSAEIRVDSLKIPVAPTDDVCFQATTRGGRVMDHILGNKAVFKSTTDAAGNVALIGGLTTAAVSDDRTAQEVGLGIALAGLGQQGGFRRHHAGGRHADLGQPAALPELCLPAVVRSGSMWSPFNFSIRPAGFWRT